MEFSSHTSFLKLPISVLLGFSGFSWFSRDSAIPLINSKVSGACLGLMTHVVQNRKVCRTFSTSVSTCWPIAYNPIIANSSIARRDKLNKKKAVIIRGIANPVSGTCRRSWIQASRVCRQMHVDERDAKDTENRHAVRKLLKFNPLWLRFSCSFCSCNLTVTQQMLLYLELFQILMPNARTFKVLPSNR